MTSSPLDGRPDSARLRLKKRSQPSWVSPMLATLTDERFSRDGWLFEPKLDGERCLAFGRGGTLQLLSRNRKPLNEKYPEITEAFQRQRRARPLRHRKQVLGRAFDFHGSLRLTTHRDTEGEAYYRRACRRGWEGVIAKDGASVYVSGRTRAWLKFKCAHEQEFVIGGYPEPRGQRVGFGALLIGFYHRGGLVYAGKVGTGFDTATLHRLGSQLRRLETTTCPFVSDELPRHGAHWVRPKLVAQIRFTEWTPGGKVRHPRFLGLREDKKPEEVVKEG